MRLSSHLLIYIGIFLEKIKILLCKKYSIRDLTSLNRHRLLQGCPDRSQRTDDLRKQISMIPGGKNPNLIKKVKVIKYYPYL